MYYSSFPSLSTKHAEIEMSRFSKVRTIAISNSHSILMGVAVRNELECCQRRVMLSKADKIEKAQSSFISLYEAKAPTYCLISFSNVLDL